MTPNRASVHETKIYQIPHVPYHMQMWRKQTSEAEKKSKELRLETQDAEKILHSQMRLYEAKLDAQLTKKYGSIEAEIKDLNKIARQAKGRARAIETCLVKKYANVPPPN